ncbi:S8 family serine peptidase [Trichocoleus sp. FACHB-46]|uniref:S8 family serine peptidase n=1 Tax=Trichocoleus desertorum GB2-A4 TaxID=2933944 RepID=A0ABV0JDK2_9CYAN
MTQPWMLNSLAGLWGGLSVTVLPASFQVAGSSLGEAGIDAYRLQAPPYNLTGNKVAIGQVEIGRPGKFGVDKAVNQSWAIALLRVFFRDGPAKGNTHVDGHAQNVASIMVSADPTMRGVAPKARLYASAVGLLQRNGQPEECLSAQHVAQQNGGDIRAINFSFGESLQQDPRPRARLDGNALLTQCLDWSTRAHDVLYVVAGNQGRGGISIPTDNFNGVNVAFTRRLTSNGPFAQVDAANLGDEVISPSQRSLGLESNVGPRRAISLVAPGSNIVALNPDGKTTRVTGTSFAAPHVTASVALLQEFGDAAMRRKSNQWGLDARRHEVMKAVLLNSADKVRDRGDGWTLGMSRTILDRNQQDWFASDAYRDRTIPLNLHMGTGQLNTFRAYQQFQPGQWNPTTPVPPIGWDYRTVATQAKSSFQDYVLEQPLQQGSFVSVTLAWARRVELQDQNRNGEYDINESFSDRGLNNLDLYLMRAEDNDPADSIWASVSEVDSVEHIFYAIPTTGRYKIRVLYRQQMNQATQPYGLAWWTVPAR